MKSALLFAVAAVIISSVPLLAHQAATGAQTAASASVPAQTGQPQANASASADGNSSASATASMRPVQMRPVHAELMRGLDSKSAHVGQTVTAKTMQSFRTADGTRIPKGSHLIGRVTEVQAHGHGHSASSLGIIFDHAQLKGGQSLPIRSMIESVSRSASAVAMANADNRESMDAMTPMGGGPAMGGAPAMGARGGGVAHGGGLVGGTVNSATSATGNLSGNAAGLGNSADGALSSSDNLAANTTGGLHGAVTQTAGAAASMGTHATGIPGVMLHSMASGTASGVLSASGRNVHLDSGTQMVLGVAGATGR